MDVKKIYYLCFPVDLNLYVKRLIDSPALILTFNQKEQGISDKCLQTEKEPVYGPIDS